jgi:photosystem II stability/assembly factor-like uncharacterized protein
MDRSGAPTLIAQAPKQETHEPAPPPAFEQAQKTAPAPETPAAKTGSPNSNAEPSAEESLKAGNEIRKRAPGTNEAENLPAEKKESAAAADANKAKSLAMPPPPPAASPQPMIASRMNPAAPSPQSRAQADSSAPAESEAARTANQSVTTTEAAPQVEVANGALSGTIQQKSGTDLPLNGRNYQALAKLRLAPEIPILLKSVSGVALWRAGIAGVIERSTDAGKTWITQTSPSKEDWLGGAVVSETVCWVAGRNGAIARTTDGANWESVTSPSQAALINGKKPDWIVITARNAQSATITANDGSKYATSDGGKTWQRQ